MYKAFFGLKENPFNMTTDPRYLYLTRGTQEALGHLTYGIESHKGFILLTGEVGTGKTTLLNKLLESLNQQGVATAFVFNSRLNESQFFDYMMTDFGITCKSRMKSQVLFALHRWLLDRYQAGEQTVLIVDEAQNLSRQTLEEIRLLTNLETSTEKLLHIVLAGQPEFEDKLNQREFRQLRQRIALRAQTLPLEPGGYILERLRIAGSEGEEIFSPLAIEAVHRHARGIPRITNLLCEHALVKAFLEGQKVISPEMIDQVAKRFSLDEEDLRDQPESADRAVASRRPRKQTAGSRVRRAAKPADAGAPESLEAPSDVNQVKRPLFIYGCGADGAAFYEQVHTIATNVRGGLISMHAPVQPGQRLLVTNEENECSQECVVGFVGARLARGVDVAFEFSGPAPDFWGAAETSKSSDTETQQAYA
jgi:type II secretory pathway predicted ATPase ExeA